jgi:diaminopimelate decarboxylase
MLNDSEFAYRNGALACEDVPLPQIADEFGTPAYVYSRRALVSRFQAYDRALAGLSHKVCFAVKANSNLAILSTLAREGAGFDIVSGGELHRVLLAGGDPSSVVFSGVGKTDEEIRFALGKGIHSFNCESEAEIVRLSETACSLSRSACIAIRVNPDVDAVTHPYISTGLREHKFGVDIEAAPSLYERASKLPGIETVGVSCHIGSQLLETGPLLESAEKVIRLVQTLRSSGIEIKTLDLGGGLGVPYRPSDRAVRTEQFIEALRPKIEGLGLTVMFEPGRSIVAEAGVLLTRVILTKQTGRKTFVIVDGGMNDLIRPALYQAHHEIVPVESHPEKRGAEVDIVGPVCETGDFFARGRLLAPVKPGDLLAIRTAGAYGFVLSSNYNSRPRACELLVDRGTVHVARRRESYDDLVRGESII